MLQSVLPHKSDFPEKNGADKGSEQAFDDILSDDNLSLHDKPYFESSYGHDGRLAAEKHAYLHSQHGMEDSVFWISKFDRSCYWWRNSVLSLMFIHYRSDLGV